MFDDSLTAASADAAAPTLVPVAMPPTPATSPLPARGASARRGPRRPAPTAPPAPEQPQRPEEDQAERQQPPVRFVPRSQADLAPSGVTTRIRANLAALQVREQLRQEQRPATGEEQQVLARWSSWGAVAQPMFARPEYAWARDELSELLSAEEVAAARGASLNAHFTDAALVQQVWRVVSELGFTEGQVLEPGCGSGNFVGFAPAGAQMIGVELDPATADIARLLYPDAAIRTESFAATRPAAGMFDLTVGNVPFGSFVAHDPTYNPDRLSIHNAFIYKALQLTRPGGLVAVFTSRYTMDGTDNPVRERLASLADLVGAVRLPSGAHRQAAGTDVVTDLLILRRREPDRQPDDTAWKDSLPMQIGDEQMPVNVYFQQHPELVLGQMSAGRGAHSENDLMVEGPTDASLLLGDALDRIVPRAKARGLTWTPAQQPDPVRFVEPNPLFPDRFIRAHDDGTFTQLTFGVEQPFPVADNQAAELRALLGLRDTVRDLLLAEAASETSTPEIEDLRRSLNQRYDAYLDRYGPINRFTTSRNGQRRRPGQGGFRKDPFASLVRALEDYDPATGMATKSEIFDKRAELPRQQSTAADNATDALAICLDRHGELRLPVIAELLGLDQRAAREALGTLVFDEPFGDRLILAGEYLSGNVRAKLDVARKAAAADARYAVNVTALSEVVPADIPAEDIRTQLGAAWIDALYVEQFLRETLNDPRLRVDHPAGSTWNVISYKTNSLEATEQWGTHDVPAQQLAESLLRRKPIEVRRSTDNGSYVDVEATAVAAAKASELEERFGEWLWEDPARAATLARRYNDEFNSTRLREFAGSYLSLPGLAMNFSPRAHQNVAVERILMTPAVGLFHEVGAGKTSEMIIGAMELRRLGLAKKPVIVTPKNVLDAFAREFLERYPRARLLVGYSEDTNAAERRNFIGRAAASDWDAVLMTREAFEAIPMDRASREAYLQRSVEEMTGVIDHANAESMDSRTIKELEAAKKRAEERVERLMEGAKDDGIDFKLTGIDYIFADEAHAYKNLMTLSSMPGMSITPGSGRATDMHMKLEHLRTHYSRITTLATATPITRTLAEIYNWMRYLDPQQLHGQRGIATFDQFLATFATTTTDFEVTITGGLKLKSRVNKVVNLPELVTMLRSVSDIKTAEDLKLPTPLLAEREDGKRMPRVVVVPSGPNMREHKEDTDRRAARLTGRSGQGGDNHLLIVNDGKKAAVDLRMVGRQPDQPSKLTMVADNIARIWSDTKDNEYLTRSGKPSPRKGALQIVFCDLGVPPDGRRRKQGAFSVYDGLRDELASRGIPADQVRYVHEAGDNEYRKGLLFDECNDGKVAVLIASTGKAGVGTNIQMRAVALHHVDCTWNPSDMLQREGRIKRQGNQNSEVYIFNYVAEGSFDGYVYQTVERKARTIGPVMSGKINAREVDDVGEVALSLAEVKALASGNPLLLEVNQAERDLKQLQRMERNHTNGQRTIRHTITSREHDHKIYLAAAAEYSEAVAVRTPTRGDAFAMTVGEQTHRRRPDAEAALHRLIGNLRPGTRKQPIGTIGGLTVTATADPALDPARRRVTLSFAQATHSEVTLYANGLSEGGKAVNIVQRLENRLGELESQQAHFTALAEAAAAEAERASGQLGRPFRYTAELEAAREKYTELKAKLAEQNKTKQAEPAGAAAAGTPTADAALGRAERPSTPSAGPPGGYQPPAPPTLSGPIPPPHRLADHWHGDIDAALQVAVALTELRGFTSKKVADHARSNGARLHPTSLLAEYLLTDTSERTAELRERVRTALTPATAARAALIRQWAQALPDNGRDYLSNLGRTARLPRLSIDCKELPTLASAVSAYARHEQQQAAFSTAAHSAWQGNERQRLTVDQVTVLAIQANGQRTGLDVTTTHVDARGNLYTWRTNQRPPFTVGDRGQISGTVKAHQLASGTKETVLTRCEWTAASAAANPSEQTAFQATTPPPAVKHDVAQVAPMDSGPAGPTAGQPAALTTATQDAMALAAVAERINQRHGTNLTPGDLTAPFQEAIADKRVRQAALANDEHSFCLVFNDVFEAKVADHIDTNANLASQYFARDPKVRNDLNTGVSGVAWRVIRDQEQAIAQPATSPAATARLSFAATRPADTPAPIPETASPHHPAPARPAHGPAQPATNAAALARAAGSTPAGSPTPAASSTTDSHPAWTPAYARETQRTTRVAR